MMILYFAQTTLESDCVYAFSPEKKTIALNIVASLRRDGEASQDFHSKTIFTQAFLVNGDDNSLKR